MEMTHQSLSADVTEGLKIPSAPVSVRNPTGTCEHFKFRDSQEGWKHQSNIQL